MKFPKIKTATARGTGKKALNGFEIGSHKKLIRKFGEVLEFEITNKQVIFSEASKTKLLELYSSGKYTKEQFYKITGKFCGIDKLQGQLSSWKHGTNIPNDRKVNLVDKLVKKVEDSALVLPNNSLSVTSTTKEPKTLFAPAISRAVVLAELAELDKNMLKVESAEEQIAHKKNTINTKREAFKTLLTVID